MAAPSGSARSKHAAHLTGQPGQVRGNGARAQHAAALTGQPPKLPASLRAKVVTAERQAVLEHLGKTRVAPGHVEGAHELLGQVLHTADGRAIRVLGLEVVQPETEHTYAGAHSYGCAADATFVARRQRPLGPAKPKPPLTNPGHVMRADATAVRPPFDITNIHPQLPAPPLTPQQQGAKQIGDTERNWNGLGAMLEGNALTRKAITPVNNSAFKVAQRVNRIAGRKVIVPSRMASSAAKVARSVGSAKLARLGGKIGKVAGPLGMGLTFINISLEVKNDTWDAHTVVNGAMLVVSAAGLLLAGVAASPVFAAVGAVIVIYGVLDYAFDIGGSVIDPLVGRKSGFWGGPVPAPAK